MPIPRSWTPSSSLAARARRPPGPAVAAGLFAALAIGRNLSFWRYAAAGGLGLRSVPVFLVHAVVPASGILLLGAVLSAFGRACWRPADRSAAPGLPSSFALGLGLLAAVHFLLSLIRLPGPLGLAFLLAAAAFIGRREFGPPRLPLPESALEGAAAGLIGYALWRTAVVALAPPVHWDALAYHLAVPKLYRQAGRIVELPWLLQSHWPHLIESLYASLPAAGPDALAAPLHWLASTAFVAAAFGLGERLGGRTAGWATAALVAAQPAFLEVAGVPHSDGAFALFSLCALLAAWDGAERPRPGPFALAGLLGGFAAASKLLGAAIPVFAAAWLLSRSSRRNVGLYAACAAAVALPWYLKTWAFAGNPVWPFASSLFGGRFGADYVAAACLRTNIWTGADAALLWRYEPLRLALPAALGLAAAALGRRLGGLPAFLLGGAILYGSLVARTHEAWRFMLPFYAPLAAVAAAELLRFSRSGKPAALGALLAAGFAVWALAAAPQVNALYPVLGALSSEAPNADPRTLYLERSLDHYAFYKEAGFLLSPASKVLLFREVRGYYLDAPYLWGDPANQALIRYDLLADPFQLLARMKELGVTHVLVNEGLGMYAPGLGYYDARTVALMEGALAADARPVLRKGPLALFELAR